MNKESQLTLRLLICGYLIYLACSICKRQMSGDSAVPALAAYAAAAVMGLSGAGIGAYHLIQYRKSKKSADQDRIIKDDEAS